MVLAENSHVGNFTGSNQLPIPPGLTTLHRLIPWNSRPHRMYPVPAPSRAYHPCFTQDSVQAILVVPQGRALVNSKPYPARLFSWRGRPSTDAPGVQISIMQRRRRKHLMQRHAVKSGAPPLPLNRKRYGARTLSLAFQGERPVAYPRNTSGVQSPNDKQRKTTHRLAVGLTYSEEASASTGFCVLLS